MKRILVALTLSTYICGCASTSNTTAYRDYRSYHRASYNAFSGRHWFAGLVNGLMRNRGW